MWDLHVHYSSSAVLHVSCGSHIFSLIMSKYVYNAPSHVIDCSDFTYGT